MIPATLAAHPPFLPYLDHAAYAALALKLGDDVLQSLNTINAQHQIGAPRFVAAPSGVVSALEFERSVVERGELIVNDTLHDVLNALVWLRFPQTKRAISEAHVALGAKLDSANGRPRRRDVLTLFDEAGMILCSDDARFAALNAEHAWRELWLRHRKEFTSSVTPILFGHGTLEQLALKPHRGLTAKALWLPLSSRTSMAEIDAYLAERIRANELLTELERRIPLPLLGLPGWFAENETATCYDDINVFRPKRLPKAKE